MKALIEKQSHEVLVLSETRPKLKKPPLYKVVLINDDFTPMDFVVAVLKIFFNMEDERAVQVMLAVHHEGRGLCGIYTRDVAETKVQQVQRFSQQHEHPLLCIMEKE